MLRLGDLVREDALVFACAMVAMFVAAGSELFIPHHMTAAVFAATQSADGGIFRQSLVNFLVGVFWAGVLKRSRCCSEVAR